MSARSRLLPESVRLFLARRVFSTLGGVTFADWMRLLQENHFRVDAEFGLRAAFVTLNSLITSVLRRREEACFGRQIDATEVLPPVFVLGHWRSGTTFLHHLLALDRRFAAPNLHQALFPHTFLISQAPMRLDGALTTTRLIDRIPSAWANPNEDEFALAILTRQSPYGGWAFPRRYSSYQRYLTFAGVERQEVERWEAAFVRYARKLTLKHQARLVFKSPTHTARIELLLAAFPEASFVHIHREPYTLFASTRFMLPIANSLMGLQRLDREQLDGRILRAHETMFQAFFDGRQRVRSDRFFDIAFESLERDPIGEMRRLYDALGLGQFDRVEPQLKAYLASIEGYQKNQYPELGKGMREQIASRWRPYFEAWGYRR